MVRGRNSRESLQKFWSLCWWASAGVKLALKMLVVLKESLHNCHRPRLERANLGGSNWCLVCDKVASCASHASGF